MTTVERKTLLDMMNSEVTIFMVNGFQHHGRILQFEDDFILFKSDGVKKLVYKHAISTIQPNLQRHESTVNLP